jgi:phosphatidylinositol alpha-1,6-mannosyltransferase
LACNAAALTHDAFIYDHLGVARAHPRLPGLRRPHAVWIHGIDVWENAPATYLAAAQRADLLLCNSHYTRQRAHELHGLFDKAEVCWLGTEEDDPPILAPGFSGPPTVLIIGRIDRPKGHEELIKCWPQVRSAVSDARLVVVGGGPRLDDVRAAAQRSSAASAIEVKGFVPETEIDAIWRSAHVLAMPSRGEGFGLVYIEAMRRSIPVIASVHDAAQEVNLDGSTGFNVDLGRKDELPDRIIQLLRDTSLAASIGKNGLAHWQKNFRFSAFEQRMRPLLAALVGHPEDSLTSSDIKA